MPKSHIFSFYPFFVCVSLPLIYLFFQHLWENSLPDYCTYIFSMWMLQSLLSTLAYSQPRVESPRNREAFIVFINQESHMLMRAGKNKKLMRVHKLEVRIILSWLGRYWQEVDSRNYSDVRNVHYFEWVGGYSGTYTFLK